MSRPSDVFTEAELREEIDWMYEFMGRMSERIRGDADVHSLADYVRKLEEENATMRKLLKDALIHLSAWIGYGHPEWMVEKARELGIEVD